ncbi:hypothetical protein [Chryseobacterium sp. OSA05B]|uniref:hypothetical protein n=1 Tax=Chryseobacterium sp. OSA05B TaxID=2862650 RepID=UPI001CBAE16E|nr:hypothetical protein [Chryseobacterium sp. OSA05B]
MIKNCYFKFLLIVPLLMLSSCRETEDHNADENYVSPHMGKWVGTYSGDLNGTLIMNVSKSGSIEVTRTVNNKVEEVYSTSLQPNGSGAISSSVSPKGFVLTGSLQTKSGIWKQYHFRGNWSVKYFPTPL